MPETIVFKITDINAGENSNSILVSEYEFIDHFDRIITPTYVGIHGLPGGHSPAQASSSNYRRLKDGNTDPTNYCYIDNTKNKSFLFNFNDYEIPVKYRFITAPRPNNGSASFPKAWHISYYRNGVQYGQSKFQTNYGMPRPASWTQAWSPYFTISAAPDPPPPPVITLNGYDPLYITKGSDITNYDFSATAMTDEGVDITADMEESYPTIDSIDTNILGSTYIYYGVIAPYTGFMVTAIRTVHVYAAPLPMCFPKGTPVLTNLGDISIEKLNPNEHTINGKEIVAITQTQPLQKHIVCFEKDSLAKNIPSQKTLCSKEHKISYQGEMTKARNLVELCEKVTFVSYNGETLYNVFLNQYDTMMINNMKCETLHPENIMAKISKIKDGQKKGKIIYELSKIIKENNIPEYQKLYASL